MSDLNKKPAQIKAKKIKNHQLLPGVLQTEPNKKMLDGTLDVMTSKGQLLPFKETYGNRVASAEPESFFKQEINEVRREAMAGYSIISKTEENEFISKASYLDIENYFKIKGLELKDGTQLDDGILSLGLPLNYRKLTEYQLYYWLESDLPILRLHADPKNDGSMKYSISNDIINKPYATIIDDLTGMELELVTGMKLYFTGHQEEAYKSADVDAPKVFYVRGVGEQIRLVEVSSYDERVPTSYLKKRPWDKFESYVDPPAKKWDSEEWDGSTLRVQIPEYVVIERYSADLNPWSVFDRWYHIGVIRKVAKFLGISPDLLAKPENQAKRPIISIFRRIKLWNWPTRNRGDIKSILPGSLSNYLGKKNIIDSVGYTIKNGDRVVFARESGIYVVNNTTTSLTATLVATSAEDDGALITSLTSHLYHRVIFKNGQWALAQNKTEPNQTPLFEFYKSDGTSLETIENINFRGGIILGFKEGNTWDPILQKNVTVSNIDYDVVDEKNPLVVGSNQIKFYTDVDTTFTAFSENSVLTEYVKGPYGFNIAGRVVPFYSQRQGLDATPQIQDLEYTLYEDESWSTDIIPPTNGFDELHVFPDEKNELKFYFNLEGYGLVEFSTRRTVSTIETFIPLISAGEFKIVCHNLPHPLTFMSMDIEDNLTRYRPLSSDFVQNNGITNGTIIINLNYTYDNGVEFVTNPYSADNKRLSWLYDNKLRVSIVRPIEKWRFIQGAYYLDKTNPIYHDYDFTITDQTTYTGDVAYLQKMTGSNSLSKKIKTGDKIGLESYIKSNTSKTAPWTLTLNPLNQTLGDINYYSLYQHGTYVISAAPASREVIDPLQDVYLIIPQFNGGTFVKHNNPLAKTAIVATNLPFDFGEIVIKQGKHYDLFMARLASELDRVTKQYDINEINALSLLDLALQNIYVNQTENQAFWYHSNMIGWGTDSYGTTFDTTNGAIHSLVSPLEPISFEPGKETLLHLEYKNKLLTRDVDYKLISDIDGYYTAIEISSELLADAISGTENIIIRQWPAEFESRIPASLAKIGLAPCYKPEIFKDTSYPDDTYFIVRHDGTRYYLSEGVDENEYPVNQVDRLLYEYEKAVWSSIAHDIENISQVNFYKNLAGGFRSTRLSRNELKEISNNEMYSWMQDIQLYSLLNTTYDPADPFTHVYQLGTGDDNDTIIGSWRALYKYFYDTDRPHTHPWEMLGYTLKPIWWDTHYSWTDPIKREALETSLRMGNIAEPPILDCKPWFARIRNFNEPEEFPVDNNGNLIPPTQLSWLNDLIYQLEIDWSPGYYSPYEQVFLSTQRGLASLVKTTYLANPTEYVNNLWAPGKTYFNEWHQRLDKTTEFWLTPKIEHDYHRSINDDGTTNFTSGMESLYAEFCVLINKDFKATVYDVLANTTVNKEFLLSGFTNKNNVRIQSTSANSQTISLFVPEENYQVRTLNHYPEREEFYSAMRIVWNGKGWNVYGFNNERTYFTYYAPAGITSTSAIKVGDFIVKEKNTYIKDALALRYGYEFKDRQELYDFIVGYGKYLEDSGFVFDDVELGDIRNWQLSAKQFIFWSNDPLEAGNFIDLNPAANGLVIRTYDNQLYNLLGTDVNVGQIVDRFSKPLFSKDILVSRDEPFRINTKNPNNPIYGIKLVFVTYETVLHLDSMSIFNDTYFLPEQGTSKRSFILGGKKSQSWTGKYHAPGYTFVNLDLIPNYDTLSEVGRNLLDVENVLNDTTILQASRAQFGLNKNAELRQLFLQESNELLFKNAINYNKGTKRVFNSLEPLTHKDGTSTLPYEEYMVRMGEFGNVKNIEFYEFQLRASDMIREPQVIKFEKDIDSNDKFIYINDNSKRWVYRPYGKNLRFNTYNNNKSVLQTAGPILRGDTDYIAKNLDDVDQLYSEYEPLWSIKHYDETVAYKPNDLLRHGGKLYYAITTVSPGTWTNNSDKFNQIDEPYLPNIFVESYGYTNPDLSNTGFSRFTPGTWQVLQTVDREVGVVECCPGLADTSKARIYTNKPHKLSVGDKVVLVNVETKTASLNGIWTVYALDEQDPERKFYIDAYVSETINTGKIFTLKPVRFKNVEDLELANEDNGYSWKKKFNPKENAIGLEYIEPPLTASGYTSVHPIAIIDDSTEQQIDSVSYDYGNYSVISVSEVDKVTVKTESLSVNPENIEHLIIYDYYNNKTLLKVELFDPKKLKIHKALLDDIDIISRVDPAKYNRTTNTFKSVYTSIGWYEEHVGERWWDTSTIRFTDYESGTLPDRVRNWGSTLDNKLPDIYEWTRSDVHPSKWADKGNIGQPYVDMSTGKPQYSWVEEQELDNGTVTTVYYFWVKSKDSIPEESMQKRIYSTAQLSKILLNPDAAGLAWWAPISSSSMVIKGIEKYLNDDSTVVQIKMKEKGEEKHQQWLFITENNPVCVIPEWMHIRFRDSLATFANYRLNIDYVLYDATDTYEQSDFVKFDNKIYVARRTTNGIWNPADWQYIPDVTILNDSKFVVYISKRVPDDNNLHPFNRYGNEIRPYLQSWFTNVLEARRTFIKRTNELLLRMDLVNSTETWDRRIGITNYIFGDRSLDMTKMWYYADFVSSTYDVNKPIVMKVEQQSDIYSANISEGEYIKVLETGAIYEKTSEGGFVVVYRKNGTIQFVKDLYSKVGLGGWDLTPWDNLPWDYDLNAEIAVIVEALRYDIFVSTFEVNYNNMICTMLRYVMSEQVNVNWVIKSSTIQPYNVIGQTFENSNDLVRDNISVLNSFYDSVKAYRDKNRNGNINKSTLEPSNMNIEEIRSFDIKLRYNRNNYGTTETIGTTITGVNFVPVGWDNTAYDTDSYPVVNNHLYADVSWDVFNNQTDFDQYIEKIYQGYAGLPPEVVDIILTGSTKSKYYRTPNDEEAVDARVSENLIIDVAQRDLAVVREHYVNNTMSAFILTNSVQLAEDLHISDTHISLTNIDQVPDASQENPGAIWIGNERVSYTVKTATGVSGLIRGSLGTTFKEQCSMSEPVYVLNAHTILHDYTPLQSLNNIAPFYNDPGETMENSKNPIASKIVNYIGS